MRLFPAVNLAIFAAVLLMPLAASAQSARQPTPDNAADKAQLAASMNAANASGTARPPLAYMSPGAQALLNNPSPLGGAAAQQRRNQIDQQELEELLKDPDSPQSKARALALQAKKDGEILNFARRQETDETETVTDEPVPPEMEYLQNIHKSSGTNFKIADEEIDAELMNLDLRKEAQKEAALSYGARGGLAKRSYQVMERLKDYEDVLDRVFDFRALLVQAPSGLLIEPPIVSESLDAILITASGNEAAVADRVLNINKQSKIVSAPRDWRHYLFTNYSMEVPPPPKVLWPKDAKEQSDWNGWVRQGWIAGYAQGEESFDTNVNRLVADYNGMVRYRMLLSQGMISQPYALHEDRGVTGGKNEMRVGDRALRITGPSQFLTGSELWKPADR